MCVHARDAGYLFPASLASLARHLEGVRSVHVVTNDPPAVREAVAAAATGLDVEVSADADWLSRAEGDLPGWYRQQLVKLRSHRVVDARWVTNLGADTLLLRDVALDDLVAPVEGPSGDRLPVMWWRRHRLPDQHWWYERARVRAVGELLGTDPRRTAEKVDWINDLYTFDAALLRALEEHLVARLGSDPYARALAGRGTTPADQRRFGEWTLYTAFVLDVLGLRPQLRDSSVGFMEQVHSPLQLRLARFGSTAVHLVPKGLDVDDVLARVRRASTR
jgi:hypothetical protein